MKNYTMFSFEFLVGDHFAQLSKEARLYYIELNFYANNGFVANPIKILDANNYDKGILQELISNDDILKIPDRSEVFITAYFAHNPKLNRFTWKNTPYAVYWENRLFVKPNGIAKLFTDKEMEENLKKKQAAVNSLPKFIEPKDEKIEDEEDGMSEEERKEMQRIIKTPWLDE